MNSVNSSRDYTLHKKSGRGMLTRAVQREARKHLGREICCQELRLMPYVLDCLVNDRNISPIHVNTCEREILQEWMSCGWLSSPASDLSVDRDFYTAMQHIVFVGYVQSVGRKI